eukprot:1170160-Pyramimonas_sp.AAC.1
MELTLKDTTRIMAHLHANSWRRDRATEIELQDDSGARADSRTVEDRHGEACEGRRHECTRDRRI